jgi:hypothetical protein
VYISNFNLIACQHYIYTYTSGKGEARNMGIKELQQTEKRQKCIGTEFDKVPRRVNDGYTASMTVKFNLMSTHFINRACFEADRL